MNNLGRRTNDLQNCTIETRISAVLSEYIKTTKDLLQKKANRSTIVIRTESLIYGTCYEFTSTSCRSDSVLRTVVLLRTEVLLLRTEVLLLRTEVLLLRTEVHYYFGPSSHRTTATTARIRLLRLRFGTNSHQYDQSPGRIHILTFQRDASGCLYFSGGPLAAVPL